MTVAASSDKPSSPSVEEKARQLYQGVALAPMVRASTLPLRTQALNYGADFVYTEELVDRAISECIRVENPELHTIDYIKDTSKCSAKVKRRLAREGGPPSLLLRIDPAQERGKLVYQLGTGETNLALEAAKKVHKDVDAIDINIGCPKKFSVSGGMGSALLQDPDRAANIIRALRQAFPELPISCKIRLIKDAKSTLDFCDAMVEAGALAIAIHARRVGDESMVPADWPTLKHVVISLKKKYPSLPVLINGDFYTRQEWTDMMEQTGANGVLLARPALYNMSIFRQPTPESSSPFGYDSPLLLSKTVAIQDYLKECLKYNTHYKNIKYVVCEMMNSRRAPTPRVPLLPQDYPGGQTIAKVCSQHSTEAICKVSNIDVEADKPSSAQASAHRFKDSYILKQMQTAAPSEHPCAKRLRVADESSNDDKTKEIQ